MVVMSERRVGLVCPCHRSLPLVVFLSLETSDVTYRYESHLLESPYRVRYILRLSVIGLDWTHSHTIKGFSSSAGHQRLAEQGPLHPHRPGATNRLNYSLDSSFHSVAITWWCGTSCNPHISFDSLEQDSPFESPRIHNSHDCRWIFSGRIRIACQNVESRVSVSYTIIRLNSHQSSWVCESNWKNGLRSRLIVAIWRRFIQITGKIRLTHHSIWLVFKSETGPEKKCELKRRKRRNGRASLKILLNV